MIHVRNYKTGEDLGLMPEKEFWGIYFDHCPKSITLDGPWRIGDFEYTMENPKTS